MTKLKPMNKLTRSFGKAGLKIKKHSPEILMIAGIAGVVTSAVLACKATTKASAIIEKAKANVNTYNDLVENPEKYNVTESYTKEDAKKDTTIAYTQAGLQLAKIYAPAITLGVLSITCILASNNILRKRSVALAAAYTTVDNSFKNYRKRVIERFGEELDKELKYNIKAKEVEEVVVDEKGEKKTVKKSVDVVNSDMPSAYCCFFDNGCSGWQKDAEHNKWYLLQQQNYANEKLKAQGYLFLNDVYDMIDVPRTKAGQIVGWLYNEKNPTGDNYVDFGIFNAKRETNRDFVNGLERTILLDFNVDGPIIDLI